MAKKKMTRDLLPTGIAGLDEIFNGGIRKNNVVLIEGTPGTGKTTLGVEFIYRGARNFKEKGLIVSFGSSPERIIRDAEGLGWDLEGMVKKNRIKILHTSPSVVFHDVQMPEGFLLKEISNSGASRVLIDGLSSLKIYGETNQGRPYRETLYALISKLHELGVTVVMTKESNSSSFTESDHENALCDTVISLGLNLTKRNHVRSLEIKKSRGQQYVSGQHTFRIIPNLGVRVYRRIQSYCQEREQRLASSVRFSTGVKSLDPMMGGGVYEGSVTLAVGISGTGKSVLGLQFLAEGALRNKNSIFVTLDEHPLQVIRNGESLKLDVEGMIDSEKLVIHYENPLDLELDVHFSKIIEEIEKHKVKRLVMDSLVTYERYCPEEAHQFLQALSNYCKSHLITALFCYESPELLGISQISKDLKASTIVDNIILLNYVEISTQIRRAITVPKVRGTAIPQKTREFVIEEGGIRLLEDYAENNPDLEEVPQLPFSSYYGLLSRSPARHSPVIEERIARGEKLPESTPLS